MFSTVRSKYQMHSIEQHWYYGSSVLSVSWSCLCWLGCWFSATDCDADGFHILRTHALILSKNIDAFIIMLTKNLSLCQHVPDILSLSHSNRFPNWVAADNVICQTREIESAICWQSFCANNISNVSRMMDLQQGEKTGLQQSCLNIESFWGNTSAKG